MEYGVIHNVWKVNFKGRVIQQYCITGDNVTRFAKTWNNPAFKIENIVSWCSRCLKPSSVAISSQNYKAK